MILKKEDGELFFKLWLPLLAYVNNKYGIHEGLLLSLEEGIDFRKAKEIANHLWEDVSLIDIYLAECGADLTTEEKALIEGWKQRVKGAFILERHLKKGSIFISMEDEAVYQVCGITSSWEEMLDGMPLPIILETVLIPFRGVIISDGLVMVQPVMLGGYLKKQMKEIYLAAKKDGTLRRS